ncbi:MULTISPECIES: hypothetical protein [Nocardiaceae]|uniref:hypothetical protein n=1 Tax=Nocardiaceae TaxID=85025 RepID=UPI000AB5B876|nr:MULTISPECIES: hypothetical protein [Rhodococcus]
MKESEPLRDLLVAGTHRAAHEFAHKHRLENPLIVTTGRQLQGLRLSRFRVHLIDIFQIADGDWNYINQGLNHLAKVEGRSLDSFYGNLE